MSVKSLLMAEGEVTGPGTDVPLAGRYRLLSVLGRGGMGTVWRATDETLDREVAIKEIRLHPSLTDEERETAYARMMREARASARLGHPGVVTVHDVVVQDERPWLVMELVPSRSMQDLMDEDGPQPARRVAALGRQVAAALRAAHAVGILHRDVKPANVLVTDEGRAVLTDFGIAQLSGDATLTRTGMVMGSPAYMSPERVKGETAGPASDVWALGATLYAIVEGKAPHHRSDAMAVLAAIMTLDAPPARNAGPLAPVLTAMLDRDPARRPNIDQVEQELGRVASGETALDTVKDPEVPVPPAWTEASTQQAPQQAPQQAHQQAPQQAWSEAATRQAPQQAWSEGATRQAPQAAFAESAHRGEAQAAFPESSTQRVGAQGVFPDHGTHAVEARQGGGGGGSRIVLGVIGGVAALAIVGTGGYYFLGRDSGNASAGNPTSPLPSPSSPKHKKTEPPKPKPSGPPPGMSFQNVNGLRLAIPDNWQRKNNDTFSDKATNSYVVVDTRVWNGTPEAHWRQWVKDPNTAAAMPGFKPTEPVPAVAKGGQPASDLEWTWMRNGELSHSLDRGFRKGGQPYAVQVVTTERRWETMRPTLIQVLQSAG